jgi:hypothetical protein
MSNAPLFYLLRAETELGINLAGCVKLVGGRFNLITFPFTLQEIELREAFSFLSDALVSLSDGIPLCLRKISRETASHPFLSNNITRG